MLNTPSATIPRPFSVILPDYPEQAVPVLVVLGDKALVPTPGTEKLIWVRLEGCTLGLLLYPADEVAWPPWKDSIQAEDNHAHDAQ